MTKKIGTPMSSRASTAPNDDRKVAPVSKPTWCATTANAASALNPSMALMWRVLVVVDMEALMIRADGTAMGEARAGPARGFRGRRSEVS